jgi:low temperature requirement protein LtrA
VSLLSELKVAHPPEARPVSPVELFYDLFIAATLAKLGPVLADNLSKHPIQILYFIVVFLLVFESWIQVGASRLASISDFV